MIRNRAVLEEFESCLIRRHPPDFHANLRIVDALCDEARLLGALPPKDPLEEIEVDVNVARAINVLAPS